MQQNNLGTVTNENDEEIPKVIPEEKYISREERQKIINNIDNLDIDIIV